MISETEIRGINTLKDQCNSGRSVQLRKGTAPT